MAGGCAGWYIEDAGSGMLYKRGRLLGEGAFGRCYQLTEVASGRVYAAKVIPRARLTAVGIGERVERERELHGRLHHRHIVRLHGHFADRSHVYLLLEYCSRRVSGHRHPRTGASLCQGYTRAGTSLRPQSLADILRVRGRLTEPEVRYYLRQIISGLRYLHGQGIVHRDLKLSNFLVTEKMRVKIGDLGLARHEAPAGRRWGYTALAGSPPFEAAERQELYRRIRAARYPLPPHLSPHARALIARLLAPEPAARPSLRDVLDHGFFTQGFTPETLPPHACRSVPIFVGRDPLCGLLRGAAAALGRGRLCRERRVSPPHCPIPAGTRRQPSPCHEGEASAAGPEPRTHPLRKPFISAGNRLKSSR
ncbi:inactive serine/threonine-protein kinase PLK5 isoform X3 [Nyctibius grandis]|uniref:inactive serine/threonine-protein kinase PLK5 isoform X3 n=1 Tax=Nyctibius grandis TaxID=48427 RepID=UPI0035BBA0F6